MFGMSILHSYSKIRDDLSSGVCRLESGSFLTVNPDFQACKLPALSKDAGMHIYAEASQTKPKLHSWCHRD